MEGRFLIQFVPRTIEDVLALDDGRRDERAFEVVERVSRINQGVYDQLVSPWVKALSNEASAWALRMMNPVRLEHAFFSDLNPWMAWVKPAAEAVRADRQPVSAENPFLELQRKASHAIVQWLDQYRVLRDGLHERAFKAIYESPAMALAVGADPQAPERRGPQDGTWEREELANLKRREVEASIETGTLVDAWARLLLYVRPSGEAIDERPFNMVRRMIADLRPENIPSLAVLQAALKRQAFVLALDEERAMAALPKLAPDKELLRKGFNAARLVLGARGELTSEQHERLRKAAVLAGLEGMQLQ
jgi:transposase-like protein